MQLVTCYANGKTSSTLIEYIREEYLHSVFISDHRMEMMYVQANLVKGIVGQLQFVINQ